MRRVEPTGGGFEGTAALWHGSGGEVRARQGLILSVARDRWGWAVRTRAPDADPVLEAVPDQQVDARALRVDVSVPLALTCPVSERVGLSTALTSGLQVSGATEARRPIEGGWTTSAITPWLAASAGISFRAAETLFVDGVFSSSGYGFTSVNGRTLNRGDVPDAYGTLPLTASLMLSTRPRQKPAPTQGVAAP